MSDTTNTTSLRERLLSIATRLDDLLTPWSDSGEADKKDAIVADLRAEAAALSPPALDAPVAGAVVWISPNALAALDKCRNDDHNGCVDAWMRPTETYSIPVYASPVAAQAVTDSTVKRAWAAYNERQDELDAAEDRPLLDRMDECMRAALESLAHPNAAQCDAQGAG